MIAILGTGNVARSLTPSLVAAGKTVSLGSRTPDKTPAWLTPPLRGQVTVTTWAEAAKGASVVVDALPGSVALDVLTGLADELANTVLVDVANAVEVASDGLTSHLLYPESSLAERLQAALPATSVVKALNTMHESIMANPSTTRQRVSVFLSGDHEDAKEKVRSLLGEIGWPRESFVDLGGVASARFSEMFLLSIRNIVGSVGPVPFGLAVAT